MTATRVAVILCCLAALQVALATDYSPGAKDPTQVLNDANQLKQGLLNKNSPYNPAPVQVQVSATESPPPSKPPQTNPPPTTPTPTTTAAPPVASCTGQANGVRCATGSATILGGRCVSGACQGTPVTFCSGSAKPACKLGAPGRTASFCDPIADPGVLPTGSTGVLEVGTPAAGAGCTTTSDCAIGFLCDAYYSGTTAGSAGGCVANC